MKLNRSISHPVEFAILAASVLLFTYILYVFNLDRYLTHNGDSAGYVDLIKSISAGYGMISPIFSSAYSVFPLLPMPSAEYCASELLSLHHETSFSTWHPYLIAYPMSGVASLFGLTPLMIAALANAINLAGGCAIIYLYLRQRSVGIAASLLMVIALIAFQPWVGHLNGQYYFDRLMFFPGLLLLFTLVGGWFEGRTRVYVVIASFLVCVLISERAAIITSAIVLSYWMIEDRLRFRKENLLWLALGFAGICYVYVYMKLFQNSFYYAGISFDGALANLKSALFPDGALHEKTMKWFLIIAPFLVLALIRLRYAVLVLIAVIPNLLVQVGGAEKTGFITHYHAVYLPVLIGMVVINFAHIFGKSAVPVEGDTNDVSRETGKKDYAAIGLATILIIYNFSADITPADQVARLKNLPEIVSDYAAVLPGTSQRLAIIDRAKFLKQFISNVPKGASISSLEDMMPSIESNGNRFVDYMPIGLGANDYMIAEYVEATGQLTIPSFLGQAEQRAIAACIQQRLVQQYVIIRAETYGGVRYVLYNKRIPSK